MQQHSKMEQGDNLLHFAVLLFPKPDEARR
jgi:hypothetical protein